MLSPSSNVSLMISGASRKRAARGSSPIALLPVGGAGNCERTRPPPPVLASSGGRYGDPGTPNDEGVAISVAGGDVDDAVERLAGAVAADVLREQLEGG